MTLRSLAVGLALLLLLPGCRVATSTSGDDHFLRSPLPKSPGVTTSAEVATAIGPPDEIRFLGDRMWFIYRFREASQYSLVLTYYLDVVKWLRNRSADQTLFVVFDANDRLLYWATQERQAPKPG